MLPVFRKYKFLFSLYLISSTLFANPGNLYREKYDIILFKCQKHARTHFDSAYYYGKILSDYAIQSEDSFLIQESYHQLGNIFFYANKYDKAIYYCQKAAEINKLIKNTHNLVVNYIDLSFIYLTIGQDGYKKAMYWNDKAKEMALNASDSTKAFYYSKSGTFHLKTNNLEPALIDFKEGYKYYSTHRQSSNGDILCGITNNIGVVFQKMHLYDSSMVYFNKVYQFPNKPPFNRPRAISIVNAGISFYLMGQYNEAVRKTHEGISILRQFNLTPKLIEGYNNLSLCFEKLGRLDSALIYNRKYYALKDSIYTGETKKQIVELENKQVLDLKDKEIITKNLELEKQKNKQQFIIWTLILIVIITLAIALAFFVIRGKNIQLTKSQRLIKQSLNEKELLLGEVHHRVKNNLQLVSSMLDLQQKYLKDPEALNAINNSKNRVLSMSLIHQTLYQNGKYGFVDTKDYFARVAENVIKSFNNAITLNCELQSLPLMLDYAIPMGLITNELITNACKYAFPNKANGVISVSLKMENQLLVLKIKDNGIGTNEEMMNNAKSFGLKLIKSLCRQLEADLIIENNNGTSVTLNIKNFKLYEQI